MTHFFYSLISLIISLFFILLGVIGLLFPWFPSMRETLVHFIMENSLMMFLFGIALTVSGVAMISHLIYTSRRHSYEIRSGRQIYRIEQSLIEDYLNTYWKQLFPKIEIPNHVSIQKNKIHITADLPYIPIEQQKSLLERIEHDLSDIFTRVLGYRDEYIISISFQSKSDKAESS